MSFHALIALFLIIGFLFFFCIHKLLTSLYQSIQVIPPTSKMLKEESLQENPLFSYFHHLQNKFAWRKIGSFPTPIHQGVLGKLKFWIKREDLASPIYGGNKIRTLQYQLASCEAHLEKHPNSTFYVLGTGGSNQIGIFTI